MTNILKKLSQSELIPKVSDKLSGKIKGMNALRSMIVFGFVYRFFVPVVVTKPANWICEKYLSHKQAKAEDTKKA